MDITTNGRLGATVAKWMATNCNDHKEKKNGFDYISWVYGWEMALKEDPYADFNPVLDADGRDYWSDGRTARVYVDVTVHGVTKRMSLPVMDYKNAAIPVDKITSCDVNKAIQRCTVKCLAKFGLGLYIYAGEDLPSGNGEGSTDRSGSVATGKPLDTTTPIRSGLVATGKPLDTTTPIRPKDVNPKGREAWAQYKKLPSVTRLSEADRTKDWKALIKAETGFDSPTDVDDAGWDKVLTRLDLETALQEDK